MAKKRQNLSRTGRSSGQAESCSSNTKLSTPTPNPSTPEAKSWTKNGANEQAPTLTTLAASPAAHKLTGMTKSQITDHINKILTGNEQSGGDPEKDEQWKRTKHAKLAETQRTRQRHPDS